MESSNEVYYIMTNENEKKIGEVVHEKWIWLSRHELSREQIEDLRAEIGSWREEYKLPGDSKEDIEKYAGESVPIDPEITTENLTWDERDIMKTNSNLAKWVELFKSYDRILGVFPPSALEALAYVRARDSSFGVDETAQALEGRVWSPVSKQSEALREDGTSIIKFEHVRWARL